MAKQFGMMNKIINLISLILDKKLKLKLIINFDGKGGLKYNFGETSQEAVDKLLT